MQTNLKQTKTNAADAIRSAITGLNDNLKKGVYDYEPFLTDENIAVTMVVFGFTRNHGQPAKEYNLQIIAKIPIKDNIKALEQLSDDLLVVVDTALRIDPQFGDSTDHSYVDGADVSVEGEKPIIKQIWNLRLVEWETGLGR